MSCNVWAAAPRTPGGAAARAGVTSVPTYEYQCPHCGHRFETMHAVNAKPPKCERCGRDVRRVFTPVGIIFKGSGWHITDYRKTPPPVDGEATKSETASADKKSGDGGKADKPSGAASPDGKKSGSKSVSRSGGGGAS